MHFIGPWYSCLSTCIERVSYFYVFNKARPGRDRMPVETRFSARLDRPLGPPSLLYNGYRVFPGGRGGRGVELIHTPPSRAEGPRKV